MTRRKEFWKFVFVFIPWFYTITVFLTSCVRKNENTEKTAFVLFFVLFGLVGTIALILTVLRRNNEEFRNYWLEEGGSILSELYAEGIESVDIESNNGRRSNDINVNQEQTIVSGNA